MYTILTQNASDSAQEGEGLPESECQRLFQQVVAALAYCQRRHVCHRDLKPENILLDASKNAKVADFGLASVVAPGAQFGSYCGTPAFSAPEAFGSEAYDGGAADVWSMGVVLYECLTGTLPFSGGGGGVAKLVAKLQTCALIAFLLVRRCASCSKMVCKG